MLKTVLGHQNLLIKKKIKKKKNASKYALRFYGCMKI
jgi:hypothetical protein